MRSAVLALLLVAAAPSAADAATLVGAWSMEEDVWRPEPDAVADASAGHHPGLASGGATPVAGHGVFANAPGCSTCAAVEVPGDLGVGDGAGLTVSAWVKWTIDPATGTPNAVIVSQASTTTATVNALTANAGLFWLRTASGAAPSYQFGVRVGTYNVFVGGMTPPRQGQWTHVAGVFDGSTARLYVNGVLERTTAVSGRVAPMRPEYRLRFGSAPFDEGGAVGRRAFTGELDEVRVYDGALTDTELRAVACAAGPAEALATYCATPAPMCPACLDESLTATRWYTPSQELPGTRAICRPVHVAIPDRLPVVGGRSGGGTATLSFALDRTPGVTCTYVGSEPGAYTFSGCSSGAGPGAVVLTDGLGLRVLAGDPAAGLTRIAITLPEVGEQPTVTLSAPADGAIVGASTLPRYGFTGLDAAAILDGETWRGGEIGAEGEHVLAVTAAGCHQPSATATTRFTIDRTPPAIVIGGVGEREVRDGPVTLAVSVDDATRTTLSAWIDGVPFSGRTRVTRPGLHVLIVAAVDGAGHAASRETVFSIVDLRDGVGDDGPVRLGPGACPVTGTTPAELCNDGCVARDRGASGVDRTSCEDICRGAAEQAAITAARCEDRRWLESYCGQIEIERWNAYVEDATAHGGEASSPPSACAAAKADIAATADGVVVAMRDAPPSATERRLVPMAMTVADGTTTSYEPFTTEDETMHFRSATPNMHHFGGTASLAAQRRKESIRASSPGATIHGLSLLSQARRAQWEANGNEVMSCEEYAYEGQYNWSKYEDQVAALGGDFEAHFQAAYAPAQSIPLGNAGTSDLVGGNGVFWPVGMVTPVGQVGTTVSIPPSYAIGTMAELGWPLRARNGDVLYGQPDPLADAPRYKNAFFAMPTKDHDSLPPAVVEIVDAHRPPGVGCTTQAPGLDYLGLCDPHLRDVVDEGHQIEVVRDWAYHRRMHDLLLHSYTAEELEQAGALEDQFEDLLTQRADIVAEIVWWLEAGTRKHYVTIPAPDHPWDLHADPADSTLVAMQTGLAAGGVASAYVPLTGTAGAGPSFIVGGGQDPLAILAQLAAHPRRVVDTVSPLRAYAPLMAQRYGSAEQAGFTVVGGAIKAAPATLQAWEDHSLGMFERLGHIDYLIEQALVEADRFGCLETDPAIANPCDWAPRDFMKFAASTMGTSQEWAYQRCLANTTQVGFDQLAAGHALGIVDGAVTRTSPTVVHYPSDDHLYVHRYAEPDALVATEEPGDKIAAVGMRYAPDPGNSSVKVSKVFPRFKGWHTDQGVCRYDSSANGMNCHGGGDGHVDGYDTVTCVIDPVGEPYTATYDHMNGGLPANPECRGTATSRGCNVWTQSTRTMDFYFACLDLYKGLIYNAVTTKVGPILDEEGKARLGSSASEQEAMGDSDWNLHYGYTFGWTFGNFEAYRAAYAADHHDASAQCLLQPEMYGSINFGARAMGEDLDIARGSAHARTGPSNLALPPGVVPDAIDAHVDLVLLAINVVEHTQAGGTFHVIADDEARDEDMVPDPPITVPFALGPIPMSLKAGLTGYVGVRYGAHADVDTSPPCDHQSLSAHFSPFAGIEGFASVGLDIGLAEAGVKITLTIIDISLPFTESVGLRIDPAHGPSAYFNTNLDLVLETLGGRFSVFLRILVASWEWDLFTWDGIKQVNSLLHTEMEVPLHPLTDAVNAISGPAPHMPAE